MKKPIYLWAVITIPLWGESLSAQNTEDREWESVLEILLSQDELSSIAQEELCVLYESMHESPLNINTATREELSLLPFLTYEQIEDIHAYIYMHGPMQSLGELQLTGSLDYDTRSMLRQFVYAGPVPKEKERLKLSNVLRYGRNELIARMDIPLYVRDGFKEHSPDELERYPNRQYLGNPLSHSIRYSFNWNNRIKFGLSADQDAGEPFCHGNKLGYDFWSFYLYFKGDGLLREMVAGRYKAQFGQGLLLGGGFSMGKSISMEGMAKKPQGLKPHSSTQEYGYFQGAGVTMGRDNLTATFMASYAPLDATLAGDTVITSFTEGGYHRTPLEWSKKHNVHKTTAAANLMYSYRGLHYGATALWEQLSLPYKGNTGFWGASAYLSLSRPRYALVSELAMAGREFAFLYSHTFRFNQGWNMTASLRSYSPDYFTFHSNGLADSDVCNESGLLLGFAHRGSKLKTSGYIDLFMHPKPSHGASEPSNGMEIKVESDWRVNRRNLLYATAKFKAKQQDCAYTNQLEYVLTGRYRLRWTHTNNRGDELKAQLFYVRYDAIAEPISNGWALSGSYNAVFFDNKMDLGISCSLFSTDSFDSRVSLYESGLRYSFNFVTLSGHGTRMAMTIKYNAGKSFKLNMKVGSTIYTDRKEIGSSQQRIAANHKEDISLQSIIKF